MEVGLNLETGLSVRLSVMEEPKPEPSSVTTLLLCTVVMTVKERPRKLGNVIPILAQVNA